MASASSFSLFPSVSVKKEFAKTKRSLPSLRIPNKQPEFEMVGVGSEDNLRPVSPENDAAEGAIATSKPVLRVQVTKPPTLYIPKHPSRLSTPPETNDDRQQFQASSPKPQLPPSPPQSRPVTPAAGGDITNQVAPSFMRNGSIRSSMTATHSPVMRSIFPRYDPSVSLNQQQYFPTITRSRSAEPLSGMNGASLYTPPRTSQSGLYQAAPAPILQASLLKTMANQTPSTSLSTPETLLDLWSISNGQGSQQADTVFLLDVDCNSLTYGTEHIALSSSSQPVYTLSASANNVLSLFRTHPMNPTPTIQICDPTYTTPTVDSPLMALLFPKLAELMAIDQSSSIASTHRLERQAAAELQSEAVMRAQANEGSSLLWDSDSERYFLVHPTLLDGTSTTFSIDIVRDEEVQIIKEISILAPETDSTVKLVVLDVESRTLRVNALPVSCLPSLYTLDTLVSALLILILHLHRSSNALQTSFNDQIHPLNTPTPFFPPPPTTASARTSRAISRRPTRSTMMPWHSKSRATTRHSNDHYDEEAAIGPSSNVVATVSGNPKQGEGEVALIVQPFQPLIDVDDEKLPKGTRIVVKGIYWTFEVFIWVLGLFVNLLAAGVVGVGKIIPKL